MRFTLARDQFASALRRITPFADSKSPIPIYRHVKLVVSGNQLKLTAANTTFDVTSTVTLEEAADNGHACVAADHFTGLVGSLRADQDVNIDFDDDGNLLVASGHTKAVFPSMNSAFPVFDIAFPEAQIVVKAGELDRVLGLTRPAMGTDTDRMIFWGTAFRYERVGTLVAACDGLLGVTCRLHEDKLTEFPAGIFPRSLCVRLRGLLKNTMGEIHISVTPAAVRLVAPDWTVTSKLVDGIFPETKHWDARVVEQPIVCNAEELTAILARIDAATDLDSKALKQRGALVNIQAGVMVIRDGGHTVTDQMNVTYDGADAIEFGLNTKHIRDAIDALDAQEIELHFHDRNASMRVCARGEADDGFTTTPYRIN